MRGLFGAVTLVIALAGSSGVLGGRFTPPRPSVPKAEAPSTLPVHSSANGTTQVLPPYDTIYYFDQLIDHHNPSLGTFKQRYYFTYEFYQAGGPIILNTPGESNMEGYSGYLTNRTLPGQIAQESNGAVVFLEHRFFGQSNPYPNLNDTSLKYLSVDQAIEDLDYFANNVHLPMPGGDQVPASKAPWILIGGSYPGALTSWTMVAKPGLFWAGYASSAVVQAINWYWGYFEPVRQYMPKNCSADVEKVVNYVDFTFTFGTRKQIQTLKETLGMGNLSHVDDVAGALRNPMWMWQSLQPGQSDQGFYRFCDALEVKNGVSAGPSGWGLDHALTAYGNYMKSYIPSICGLSSQEECLGSYNPNSTFYTDTSVDNSWRSWNWLFACIIGFAQAGAPLGWPTVVSRLVVPPYDMRQCPYFYPKAFPTPRFPNTLNINTKYRGWNVNVPRLFFANGKRDPWREATLNSDFYNRQSTDLQPIAVSDGFHCSDLLTRFGTADPTVLSVQKLALAYMTKWVKEWQVQHPEALKGGAGVTVIDPATVQAPPAFAPAASPPSNPPAISVPANVTVPVSVPGPVNKQAKKVIQNSFNFGS
ncbi:Serine carboxypeptidase S28 [Ceratobasidium sp. AG-Ba]|nr:Serine carboxypeptidase S28 [Ceratobasidium sp. AG-Ba]